MAQEEANELFERIAPEDQQEDEGDLIREKMGNPADSVLFNTDWTVSTVVQQIERGNIDLQPAFQRRAAWDATRKSRLIESLIIGLPIPNLVLAENKDARGKFIVIDGKQRLISLYDFISRGSQSRLTLRDLTIRADLNGLTYEKIQAEPKYKDDVNFLDNAPIRTVVIRNWPTENFLYVIFDRLNSGSLPLSPQELRRALQPGPFLDYIDEYIAKSKGMKSALGVSALDRRMRDSELVLRFIAFEKKYPDYDGDFKEFLDDTVRYFNSRWDDRKPELDSILTRLEQALIASTKIFAPAEIFKKWNGERFEGRINRAIFDAVVRYLADPQLERISVQKRAAIVSKMKDLSVKNADFKRSIEQTTKSPLAIRTRLELWGKEFAATIGARFDSSSFRIIH